jgi:hypothetical protein
MLTPKILLLLFVLLIKVSHSQECPTFSKKKSKTTKSTETHKSTFFVDLYTTPTIQHLRYIKPFFIPNNAVGFNLGIKNKNNFAFDFGIDVYKHQRFFTEYDLTYFVNAVFLEVNSQLKYILKKRENKQTIYYPFISYTVNFSRLLEPVRGTSAEYLNKFMPHFSYIGLGMGAERKINNTFSIYAEPSLRLPSLYGQWSFITYYLSLRMSLGVRINF